MKITDMLDQSHLQVIQVLDDLPEDEWDIPGVHDDWSVKDVIAHLSSYEQVLIDMLNTLSGSEATVSLRSFMSDPAAFDREQVEARKYSTAQQVEDEYQDVQLQSSSLLAGIPLERISQSGTVPGSITDQSVADFIQMVSEHTRKHCAQIAAFREKGDKYQALKED